MALALQPALPHLNRARGSYDNSAPLSDTHVLLRLLNHGPRQHTTVKEREKMFKGKLLRLMAAFFPVYFLKSLPQKYFFLMFFFFYGVGKEAINKYFAAFMR